MTCKFRLGLIDKQVETPKIEAWSYWHAFRLGLIANNQCINYIILLVKRPNWFSKNELRLFFSYSHLISAKIGHGPRNVLEKWDGSILVVDQQSERWDDPSFEHLVSESI